jgi:hypothetical protein
LNSRQKALDTARSGWTAASPKLSPRRQSDDAQARRRHGPARARSRQGGFARINDEYQHIWTGTGADGPPNQWDLKHFEVDDGKLYQLSATWQADPKKADELHLARRWLVTRPSTR